MQGNGQQLTEPEQRSVLQRALRNANRSQPLETVSPTRKPPCFCGKPPPTLSTPLSKQRKAAVKECCSLLPSNFTLINTQATTFLANVFPEFPDLQEAIINAAYDMVEAEESQREVRYAGYKFISTLTKRVPTWARRNVDVLVQLLALDEPEDLRKLNDALAEHIDVDPTLTLTVLCMYLKNGNEKSSVASTEDLRAKILSFLGQCTSKNQYIQDPQLPAGLEYRAGLIKALPEALIGETRIIVDDLLLSIPLSESNAEMVMQILIEKAQRLLASESTHQGNATVSLDDAVTVLSAAHKVFLAASSPPKSALLALTFYSSMDLGGLRARLSPAHQVFLVERLADYLRLSHAKLQQLDATAYLASRDRVAADCVTWAKILLTCQDQLWVSAIPLLRAVLHRCQDDPSWQPSDVPLTRLKDRLSSPNFPRARESIGKEALAIIKNIFEHVKFKASPPIVAPPVIANSLPPPSTEPPPRSGHTPTPTAPISTTGKRKLDARPTAESLNSASEPIAPTPTLATRERPSLARKVSSAKPHNLLARLTLTPPTTPPPPPGPVNAQNSTDLLVPARPLKRQKTSEQQGRSLLARIGGSSERAAATSRLAQAPPLQEVVPQAPPKAINESPVLPTRPQPQAVIGRLADSENKQVQKPVPNSTSDKVAATLSTTLSTMSIKGAASKSPPVPKPNSPAASSPVTPAVSSGQTQSPAVSVAVPNPVSTIKRSVTSRTHGAVSFQRAVASISKPSTSLESLRPSPRQLQEVTEPAITPPAPQPIAVKRAPSIPAGASLLHRLTNGGPQAEASSRSATQLPRSLSERMDTAEGEMAIDEPSGTGGRQGQRKRRGRK